MAIVSTVFKVILCVLAISSVSQCLEPGDPCSYSSSVSGTCKLIYECARAISDLKAGRQPVLCKTGSIIQVVCCPSDVVNTPAPPTPANRVDVSTLRLADRKCYEYAEYVYVNKTRPVLIPGGQPIIQREDQCAVKVIPLIVGGQRAEPREFPHMARLGYGPLNTIEWKCGGTVISQRYILTAGHCVLTREGNPTYVRVGDLVWDDEIDDARPQTIPISEVIPHPSYSANYQYNDIALLRLSQNMDLNSYVRPACINTQTAYRESKAIATGWGQVEWFGEESKPLLKVTLSFFSFDECSQKFPANRKLPSGLTSDQQICAGSREGEKDTCTGDSGGPLQVFYTGIHCMYKIIGITSFGKGCGNVGTPGVYTRVSNYVDWIESIAFSHG